MAKAITWHPRQHLLLAISSATLFYLWRELGGVIWVLMILQVDIRFIDSLHAEILQSNAGSVIKSTELYVS